MGEERPRRVLQGTKKEEGGEGPDHHSPLKQRSELWGPRRTKGSGGQRMEPPDKSVDTGLTLQSGPASAPPLPEGQAWKSVRYRSPKSSPPCPATCPTATSGWTEEINSPFTHPVLTPARSQEEQSSQTSDRHDRHDRQRSCPCSPAPPPPDSSGAGSDCGGGSDCGVGWGPPPWCGGGGSCSQQIRVGPKALFHFKWWNRQGYRKGQRKM